jgi:4-amino-4-deoxy-L-arabinose transferase-like glycosyltransferase
MHFADPMGFARGFHDHYPKVAMGHWPPLFYAISGLWLLVFSPARASILLELALLTALLAWLTFAVARRLFGWPAGVLAGALLLSLPIVQTYSDEVMAESLLTLTSFAAALCFARYLERGRWQDSALFGVLASLAILTKGSAWYLALIPGVALVLVRRYSLLRRWSFWLPVPIVGISCFPWQWMTMDLVERGWEGGQPGIPYTAHALVDFLAILTGLLGWALAPLIALGIAITVAWPYFKGRVEPLWASLLALVFAVWIFHSVVPAGVEDRKMIASVPALVLFLFAGGSWLAARFTAAKVPWSPVVVTVLAAALFMVQKFSVPSEPVYGYRSAARFIHDQPAFANLSILISSQHDGEGMLISEAAMIDARPSHRFVRASKVLANVNWSGKESECYYRTPADLLRYLAGNGIRLVVTDTFPPVTSFQYQRVLEAAIARYPDKLRKIAAFHGDVKGEVDIYQVN